MSTINFSYDPEWLDTLSAPFMTNAFIAGLCIALAAGVMGYFTMVGILADPGPGDAAVVRV